LKTEILYVPDLQFTRVSYCTVQVNGRPHTEFHDFMIRMGVHEKDRRQRDEINRFIDKIGKFYGAQDQYFKREGWAERLPPPKYHFVDSDGETDFGLRLYCVRVNEELVILLNGDRKTAQSVKDCPNCKPHYDLANQLSDALYNAVKEGKIEIVGRDILIDDGFTLEI